MPMLCRLRPSPWRRIAQCGQRPSCPRDRSVTGDYLALGIRALAGAQQYQSPRGQSGTPSPSGRSCSTPSQRARVLPPTHSVTRPSGRPPHAPRPDRRSRASEHRALARGSHNSSRKRILRQEGSPARSATPRSRTRAPAVVIAKKSPRVGRSVSPSAFVLHLTPPPSGGSDGGTQRSVNRPARGSPFLSIDLRAIGHDHCLDDLPSRCVFDPYNVSGIRTLRPRLHLVDVPRLQLDRCGPFVFDLLACVTDRMLSR